MSKSKQKPILCLDFDGVLHSYTSGWQGADVVADPPVEGALDFIWNALDHFTVAIYSTRSEGYAGRRAMQNWLAGNMHEHWQRSGIEPVDRDKLAEIQWPITKPPAFLTIDDRALTFEGTWPQIEALKAFKPWNKK